MHQLNMADSGCEDTVPSKPPLLKMPEESDASMRARLYNSLSQSFPHSQLYKALHGEAEFILGGDNFEDDDDDSLYGDHLSNSCFASLRMDRRDSDDFDDDLRSLEWLQSEDLLKNIGGEKLDKEDGCEEQKENEDIKPDISLLQGATGQAPPHLPYQPQKHVNTKPPYSFSCLIFMAVENSPQKRLPVKDIYNWILTQFPYFQNAPTGWKNSVRHNLSLNKCFKKVDKDKGQSIGKGSLWCIDPAYRPNLLQALRKTPYHPYHQLQMTSTAPQHYGQYQSLPSGCRSVLPLTQRPIPNTVSPHLFPFLSRRLAQTSFDVDNEMKDVAQTLVSLKSSHKECADASPGADIGPTWKYHKKAHSWNNRHRSNSPVTITNHPHSDHAYSSTCLLEDDLPSPSSSSSIDEEYDFGSDADEGESDFQSDMEWNSDDKDEVDGDIPSPRRVKTSKDTLPTSVSKNKKLSGPNHDTFDDEQKKIHEGANALLNLAGLFANNRSNSSGSVEGKEKNSVKKVKTKKIKAALRAEKVIKKKIPKKNVEKQREGKNSGRKRAGSKRKNAGSNGKYDNDQYTTFKVGKTSDNLKKASKSLKSENGESASNKFRTKNGSNKKGQGKTKLKLSKSFGAANKLQKATNNNDNNNNDSCKPLSKERKKPVNRKTSKLDVGAKKRKSNKHSLHTKTTSKDNDTHGSTELCTTNDIKEEVADDKTVKSEERSHGFKEDHDIIQSDMLKNDSNLKNELSVESKKEITITAAGDAPLASNLSGSSQEQETYSIKFEPEDGVDMQEESEASKFLNTIGLIAATSLQKSGSMTTSSPKLGLLPASSSTPPVPSHKSPHFTRFSKKKSALS